LCWVDGASLVQEMVKLDEECLCVETVLNLCLFFFSYELESMFGVVRTCIYVSYVG